MAATMADGTDAVLKLCVANRGSAAVDEIAFYELAGGHGCAELYRADAARGALLLERLGPSLNDLQLPLRTRLEIICSTVSQLWRPRPMPRSGPAPRRAAG